MYFIIFLIVVKKLTLWIIDIFLVFYRTNKIKRFLTYNIFSIFYHWCINYNIRSKSILCTIYLLKVNLGSKKDNCVYLHKTFQITKVSLLLLLVCELGIFPCEFIDIILRFIGLNNRIKNSINFVTDQLHIV